MWTSKVKERKLANFIAEKMPGFGPKQSRNFIQGPGLSRFEVPLDSRIAKWMRDFDWPVPVSAGALGDIEYYEFVEDMFQKLCKKAKIYPCVLDAAIFSSFDV